MKQAFLFLVVGFVVLALLLGAVYMFFRALLTVWEDRQAEKESLEIAAESAVRRSERAQKNATRLDNGCEHIWGGVIPAFPDHACQKCGLEKEPPVGPCDHIWRLQVDNVPYAACESCGKRYISPKSAFQA